LDVETSELLRKPTTLPQPTDHSGLLAMRRALTSIDDLLDEQPSPSTLSLSDARRTVDYAWGSYWAGRYEQLGDMLPDALASIRATDDRTLDDLAAQLYQVTACTLAHLGHPDAAHLALREALRIANTGEDPLRVAALRGSLAWLLLTQGRFTESGKLAEHTAETVQPGALAALPRMSLWGSLLLSSATATGRGGTRDAAADYLTEAREVARHTGHRNDYEQAFGPDQVIMQTVDVQVVTEQYGEALSTARAMPRTTPLPVAAQARHLSDRALALARLGRDETATDTLLAMEHLAPVWARYQTQSKVVVEELLQRERHRSQSSRLRLLAGRLAVAS
jgi:tetratricopeptide (TPR) repeat protein